MDDITKINNNANLSRYLDRIQDTPYKPAHKKMLTDLINYAVDHDWTLRTLADKLPVSTTVMHRLLIGAYQAPTGPHLSKLDDLCGLLALRQQSASDGPFIETALARYVMQIAELTHVNQYASMLVGKTQWGKTWALKEYARRHPGTVILVRCPVVTSPGRLLYRIAAQLGLSVKGNTEFQIAKIVNRLTPEHLLIVDEIHHALDSDKTGRKGIEQLREIYDETQCGMLLVGTPVLAEYVEKNDKWKGILEQTSKRGAANIYRLPDHIETRDLETLWTYYGYPSPSRAMLATLKQQANLYGFGKTTKRLRKGVEAANNAGVDLTWDYYLAAVKKLEEMEAGKMPEYVEPLKKIMRKKTIKYSIVDLGGTRYVVLRLADLDALITTHHSLSLELISVLSEAQWERHRQLLYITQHIHVDRVSHCKVALLTKTDYDCLNMAISHLHDLLGNIRLANITVGPTEDDQPDSTSNQ